MALTVHTMLAQQEAERAASSLRADRPLWLTAAKDAVVEDGDARSAFLFVGPGGEILLDDATRYGLTLVDGKIVLPDTGPRAA